MDKCYILININLTHLRRAGYTNEKWTLDKPMASLPSWPLTWIIILLNLVKY